MILHFYRFIQYPHFPISPTDTFLLTLTVTSVAGRDLGLGEVTFVKTPEPNYWIVRGKPVELECQVSDSHAEEVVFNCNGADVPPVSVETTNENGVWIGQFVHQHWIPSSVFPVTFLSMQPILVILFR